MKRKACGPSYGEVLDERYWYENEHDNEKDSCGDDALWLRATKHQPADRTCYSFKYFLLIKFVLFILIRFLVTLVFRS